MREGKREREKGREGKVGERKRERETNFQNSAEEPIFGMHGFHGNGKHVQKIRFFFDR